jgi:hypothetical protein
MNYENQIASFLNDQLDLNSMKSNLLQKKAMIEEKIEAKKEIGAEDLGLSALIGEFGYSSASQFLSKYGVDQIKSFMSDIGLGEDTVGKVGDMLKNGLNKGDLDPDSFFDFIRGNLRDLNTSVKDIKAVAPKALSDVKSAVPDGVKALADVKSAVPDGVKALSDVKVAVPKLGDAIPDGVKAIAPEIKAILPDVKPFVGIKSSSGLGKSINTSDLDLDVMTTAEKSIFYRSLDKIGPNIKELVSNMRKPAIKETNIDDLLFKRDLASDSDPLSIEGAPEAIKMFSESGEFVGNTLSRVYNKSKLMESLPDIAPGSLVKPPPPAVGPEAPASEAVEDIAPKLVQDVAPKLAENVGEKVASEASSEAIGATTEAISGALDATGLLAPIGAAIGLGTAIYSAFTGIEDLFKTHHVSNYIPPPITSLFQAT